MNFDNLEKWFKPDSGFLDQIARYRGMDGEECPYVPSDYRTPDYSVLDRQQISFYLYWRSMLSRGECPRADHGYAWMRMCEIVNSDMDPRQGMMELRTIYDNSRSAGIAQSEVSEVMFDYAVAHDLDLPRHWYFPGSVMNGMVLSEALAPPTEWLGWALIRGSSGYKLPAEARDMDVYALVDMCLPEIDRHLRDTTDRGIADTYGDGRRTETYTVFKRFPYFLDERDFIVTYTELDTAGRFGEFMSSLCRCCARAILKSQGLRGPSVPSSFGKDLRSIVDRALADGLVYHMPPPDRAVRGTERHAVSSRERALIEMGEQLGEGTPFGDDRPRMFYDRYARRRPEQPARRIETGSSSESGGPRPYVPSEYANPDFRSFNDSQRGFYLHWREMARQGRYIDTDQGYVWLYLCELVNSQSDPEEVRSQMVGLQRAYGDGAKDFRLIGRAYLDYTLLHDLELDEPWMYPSPMTADLVMDRFVDGDGRAPDSASLAILADLNDDPNYMLDDDSTGVAVLTLRAVQRELTRKGSGIAEACCIKPRTESIRLFSQLAYYPADGQGNVLRVTHPDYVFNPRAAAWTCEVVKNSVRAVRRHRGEKGYRVQDTKAFGLQVKGIVERCSEEWFASKEADERRDRAMRVSLDAEAIRSAESDLRDVTDMMSVDTPETMTEFMPEDAPDDSMGDPWEKFASRLDSIQVQYIRAKIRCVEPKLPRGQWSGIEDSINEIALETVGDTVIDDGSVVLDYMDELTGVLARFTKG